MRADEVYSARADRNTLVRGEDEASARGNVHLYAGTTTTPSDHLA